MAFEDPNSLASRYVDEMILMAENALNFDNIGWGEMLGMGSDSGAPDELDVAQADVALSTETPVQGESRANEWWGKRWWRDIMLHVKLGWIRSDIAECRKRGDYGLARERLRRLALWASRAGRRGYCWRRLVYLGEEFQESEKKEEARLLTEEGLALAWDDSETSRRVFEAIACGLVTLGRIAAGEGALEEVRERSEDAYHYLLAAFGGSGTDFAEQVESLGRCREMVGDWKGAEGMYEQAAGAWREVTGVWHPSYVDSYNALQRVREKLRRESGGGTAIGAQSQPSGENAIAQPDGTPDMGAATKFRRAGGLRGLLLRLGASSAITVLIYKRESYVKRGELDKAIRLAEITAAVAHISEVLLVREMRVLGTLYCLAGDVRAARTQLEAAVSLSRGLVQRDAARFGRPLADCLSSLGAVYAQSGEYDRAEAYYAEAAALRTGRGKDEEAGISLDANALGVVRFQRGEVGEAVECYRQAEINARSALGEQHPLTGIVLRNLAVAYRASGQVEAAAEADKEGARILQAAGATERVGRALGASRVGVAVEIGKEVHAALLAA
jgi:tetratricopeptide (TPR) repeat protein